MPKLTYKHDWKTIKNNTLLTRHQEETRLGNIHDAVMKYMGDSDPYKGLEDIELGIKSDRVRLHSSRGAKQSEQGKHVLEFSVGGSGFSTFRTVHRELNGNNKIVRDGVKVFTDDIKYKNRWTKRTKRWFRDLFTFSKKAKEQNRKYDALVDEYAQVGENGLTKLEELIRDKYGEPVNEGRLKGKKLILKKEDKENGSGKVRYTMPGPLSMGGVRDAGEYSIDHLSEYILDGGKDYLTSVFEQYDRLEKETLAAFRDTGDVKKADEIRKQIKPTVISLKGHSRGGVAVSLGAMKLKYWIHQNYSQFEKYVNFEMVQYDPVPGYFSDKGVKHRVNLNEKDPEKLKELEKQGMMPLGDKAETTVVYSLHTDHSVFFSPQSVQGAKRILMVPTAHSVNLDAVDKQKDADGKESKYRSGYTDAKTGEHYRGSGLNELPEGVYVADEKMRLVRLPDSKTAKKVVDDVVKDTSSQKSRHGRLRRLWDEWFSRAPKKTKEKVNVEELMGRPRSKSICAGRSKNSLLDKSNTLEQESSVKKAPLKSK